MNHIVYVSAGRSGTHSLAVDSNGYVYAWGNNIDGQCGDGNTGNQRNYLALAWGDNYSKSSINRAKAVLGFTPQAFDQAINSVISTRLLATSQL